MESLRVIGLSMLLLGANVALSGQQIAGSIVGNVTDAPGSAVPEAQITVKNEGTGIEFKARTDAFGTYTVPDLLSGVYTVVAAKEGFKTFQATGVRLLSAQTARQDVALQIGPVQQTVEVVAQPQLVHTDSPTIGGTLQTPELANLPFLTTTMDGVFNLVPGMSQGEIDGNANPTIAGAPYGGSSNFTLNGITTSNPGQGGGGNVTYVGSSEMIAEGNLPSIGNMQEFKIDGKLDPGRRVLADSRYVSAGYFDTMRIPVLVGAGCRQASTTSARAPRSATITSSTGRARPAGRSPEATRWPCRRRPGCS
jgi:hypothetical protein